MLSRGRATAFGSKYRNGACLEMNKQQAMEEIVAGKHKRFAFKKAVFVDLPDKEEMTDGWFDLHDGQYAAKIEENKLVLELWFLGLAFGMNSMPQSAIVEKQEADTPHGKVPYIKLRVAITEEDMDYIYKDGKRIYL